MENPDVPQEAKFFDWAIRDSMPDWAADMLSYRPPHPIERAARRATTWAALNAAGAAMGSLPEFKQAQRRVANGTTTAHTEPAYVLGSDPARDRDTVEQMV
jgi:hypothetical protein